MALPRIHTVAEVAAVLECSPSTVYRLVESGELRGRTIGVGRKRPGLRITETALLEFLGEPTQPSEGIPS